jgi:hypothetical protein
LIRRIQSHNTINGVTFAICEFAFITHDATEDEDIAAPNIALAR